MIRRMPHDDWQRALEDLVAIQKRFEAADLTVVRSHSEKARAALEEDRNPVQASVLLFRIAGALDDFPSFRLQVTTLAGELTQYARVESPPVRH